MNSLINSVIDSYLTELSSFGWDCSDTLMQQDISDFCHMLFEIVEEGMKNTTADGRMQQVSCVCLIKSMRYRCP